MSSWSIWYILCQWWKNSYATIVSNLYGCQGMRGWGVVQWRAPFKIIGSDFQKYNPNHGRAKLISWGSSAPPVDIFICLFLFLSAIQFRTEIKGFFLIRFEKCPTQSPMTNLVSCSLSATALMQLQQRGGVISHISHQSQAHVNLCCSAHVLPLDKNQHYVHCCDFVISSLFWPFSCSDASNICPNIKVISILHKGKLR